MNKELMSLRKDIVQQTLHAYRLTIESIIRIQSILEYLIPKLKKKSYVKFRKNLEEGLSIYNTMYDSFMKLALPDSVKSIKYSDFMKLYHIPDWLFEYNNTNLENLINFLYSYENENTSYTAIDTSIPGNQELYDWMVANDWIYSALTKGKHIVYNTEKFPEPLEDHEWITKPIISNGYSVTVGLQAPIKNNNMVGDNSKDIEHYKKQKGIIESKLSNPDFINKAPKQIVEKEYKKLEDITNYLKVLEKYDV